MDRAATLTPTATTTTPSLTVDHAVFTSVRSPMGEGYRIIAASGGIRPDERMETTRRAPSHGGLNTEDPDAVGVLGFPLPTGRYCVGFVRNAGKEHTARGGLRVHTHFVFLTPEQFSAFACDPWLVAGTVAAIDGDDPILKAAPSIPTLNLGEGCTQLPECSTIMSAVEIGWLQTIVGAALRGAQVVANATSISSGSEQLAWRIIPGVMRQKRSMAFGLVYAPSRGLDLSFVDDHADEARRAMQSTSALWVDPAAPLPETTATARMQHAPVRASFDDWLALTRATLNAGRIGELIRLCDAIDYDATPEGLATTARLCEHLDTISIAETHEVAQLTNRYAGFAPTCRAQKMLVERFRKAAALRSAQLADAADGADRPD